MDPQSPPEAARGEDAGARAGAATASKDEGAAAAAADAATAAAAAPPPPPAPAADAATAAAPPPPPAPAADAVTAAAPPPPPAAAPTTTTIAAASAAPAGGGGGGGAGRADRASSGSRRADRKKELVAALRERGLELRGDSFLCAAYLDGTGDLSLQEVVDETEAISFFYRCTDYSSKLRFTRSYDRDEDRDFDREFGSREYWRRVDAYRDGEDYDSEAGEEQEEEEREQEEERRRKRAKKQALETWLCQQKDRLKGHWKKQMSAEEIRQLLPELPRLLAHQAAAYVSRGSNR
jgi:hypothetical protein